MELDGSVILVTGASGGIGAATARRLAMKGLALALAGRNGGRFEVAAGDCRKAGAWAEIVPGEITDDGYVAALPHAVRARVPGERMPDGNLPTAADFFPSERVAVRRGHPAGKWDTRRSCRWGRQSEHPEIGEGKATAAREGGIVGKPNRPVLSSR